MDTYIIQLNGFNYTLYVGDSGNGTLFINISDPAGYITTIVDYFPCGGTRFDYTILHGEDFNVETLENLLEQFTEMVVG